MKKNSKWETTGDWRIPNCTKVSNLVECKEGATLRYCEKCDRVYEYIWSGGTTRFYKMFIYEDFPKTQKKFDCPQCKGKKVRIMKW